MKRETLRRTLRAVPSNLFLASALALVAGGALLLADVALAGPVRGEVNLPDEADSDEERSSDLFYWNAWNGFLEPREEKPDPRRELAVVLTGEAVGEPAGCSYKILGGDLLPRTIVTSGGASLRIENRDGCTHELQSDDIEGFAPLATAPGNARAINVPPGGPYPVTDRLYGHIEGHIVAIDDLVACATVAEDGKYEFENVPAGEYTLKVFRDGEEVTSQPVTATDGALSIDPITLE
jgi:hypothetical protein